MNIWDYIYKKVLLKDSDGAAFTGDIIDISSAEDTGESEDCVSLELDDGKILGFFESEIKSIEAMKP